MPDGAIAFGRTEDGDLVIRMDVRGRWQAYHRITLQTWHWAYGDHLCETTYKDSILQTVEGQDFPTSADPVELLRLARLALDRGELRLPDDSDAPTSYWSSPP